MMIFWLVFLVWGCPHKIIWLQMKRFSVYCGKFISVDVGGINFCVGFFSVSRILGGRMFVLDGAKVFLFLWRKKDGSIIQHAVSSSCPPVFRLNLIRNGCYLWCKQGMFRLPQLFLLVVFMLHLYHFLGWVRHFHGGFDSLWWWSGGYLR